jgi:hypothetical protein
MSSRLRRSDLIVVAAAFVGLALVGYWLGWLSAAPPLIAPGTLP